jgi:hypothetical protein
VNIEFKSPSWTRLAQSRVRERNVPQSVRVIADEVIE